MLRHITLAILLVAGMRPVAAQQYSNPYFPDRPTQGANSAGQNGPQSYGFVPYSQRRSGITYNQFGNTTLGSNGETYNRFGNTVMDSRGNSWNTFGNTTLGSNGTVYNRFGNIVTDNKGNSWTTFGNTTVGSNGTTCHRFGQTIICN